MRIDRRLLGWGLFLIIVGAVPLLVRFGSVDRSLVDQWGLLWPLLLIGWGLGLVFRRTPVELLGSAVSVITLGLMVGGFIATGFRGVPAIGACDHDGSLGTPFLEQSGALAPTATAAIEFSCGTLEVRAVDGDAWSVTGSGPDGRGPRIEADDSGVEIQSPEWQGFEFSDTGSRWLVELPRGPELGVAVTLNAGSGDADLSGLRIGGATWTLNAGELRLDLAEVASLQSLDGTVNAGSATVDLPASVGEVDASLNAGSLTICFPDDVDLRVAWSGALGSNNLGDLGLTEVEDDVWTTPGFDAAAAHVDLGVSANAGSFQLELGGTCGA